MASKVTYTTISHRDYRRRTGRAEHALVVQRSTEPNSAGGVAAAPSSALIPGAWRARRRRCGSLLPVLGITHSGYQR